MKLLFASVLTFFVAFTALAQKSNLIFHNEDNLKFFVYLNGIKQNDSLSSNVKIIELTESLYKARIDFEGDKMKSLDKNIVLDQNAEAVYIINKNAGGVFQVLFQKSIPMAQTMASPRQNVVVFKPNPDEKVFVPVKKEEIKEVPTQAATPESIKSETYGKPIVEPEKEKAVAAITPTQESAPQTTAKAPEPDDHSEWQTDVQMRPDTKPIARPVAFVLPGYEGRVGCVKPMIQSDFEALKQDITSKEEEDDKLNVAKKAVSGNCFLTTQIIEINKLLKEEDAKIIFAKHAYTYTYDIDNFLKVGDAMESEAAKKNIKRYVKGE